MFFLFIHVLTKECDEAHRKELDGCYIGAYFFGRVEFQILLDTDRFAIFWPDRKWNEKRCSGTRPYVTSLFDQCFN